MNSVVYIPGANFFTTDIRNLYLMMLRKRKEYVGLNLIDMPEDVVEHYNLKRKSTKYGYIFISIKHGMWGLPQNGLLA